MSKHKGKSRIRYTISYVGIELRLMELNLKMVKCLLKSTKVKEDQKKNDNKYI